MSRIPGLASASHDLVERLAVEAWEVAYEAGDVLMREGDEGRAVLVLVSGEAELSFRSRSGRASPLAALGPGDVVGELSVVAPGRPRTATLTASTPVVALWVDASQVRGAIDSDAALREAFDRHASELHVARFLAEIAPLARLDDERRRWLAGRIDQRVVEAGSTIVREGAAAESCFMLRRGTAEVVRGAQPDERRLNTLLPGTLFGEAAVLTGSPRVATVRALEQCELLEVGRADLLQAVAGQAGAGELLHLARLHTRPCRVAEVTATERETVDGEAVTILKHPELMTYFRLSERGRFVWDRLDGEVNLRRLTLDYCTTFGSFEPKVVVELVVSLSRVGMVSGAGIAAEVEAGEEPRSPSPLKRLGVAASRVLVWNVYINKLDRKVTAAYRWTRPLFTRGGLLLLALITIGGTTAFAGLLSAGAAATSSPHTWQLLIVPGVLLGVLVHEAAHALTVKRFGHPVPRGGFGWYWFGPTAYVDTSEMWLAGRRERVLVSLAGPYASACFAGALSLAALAVSDEGLQLGLLGAAIPSYLMAVVNVCPLFELDGYWVLADLVDRPNLRSESLRWLRGDASPEHGRDIRRHWVEASYVALSIASIALSGAVTFAAYRVLAEGWTNSILPESVATSLPWLLGGLVVVMAAAVMLNSVRKAV